MTGTPPENPPAVPETLFRFRSLETKALAGRELDALIESYLFAPNFAEMNDPMEAFYAFDGPDVGSCAGLARSRSSRCERWSARWRG